MIYYQPLLIHFFKQAFILPLKALPDPLAFFAHALNLAIWDALDMPIGYLA